MSKPETPLPPYPSGQQYPPGQQYLVGQQYSAPSPVQQQQQQGYPQAQAYPLQPVQAYPGQQPQIQQQGHTVVYVQQPGSTTMRNHALISQYQQEIEMNQLGLSDA
ncbi:hypothetical protein BGZ65_001032, partial [Modicella reniformis]